MNAQAKSTPKPRQLSRSAGLFTILACGLLFLAASGRPAAAQSALKTSVQNLVQGVDIIASPGVPGPLCVFGSDAYPLAVGGASGDTRLPVAAVAGHGAGRVAAFGHGGYLSAGMLDHADTGTLLMNLALWAAGDKTEPAGLNAGVVGGGDLVAALNAKGFTASAVNLDGGAVSLDQDLIFFNPWNQGDAELAALRLYVAMGGGLITSATGWGWQQLNGDKEILTDFAGNKLLGPMGIAWADEYLSDTADDGFEVTGAPDELTQASLALDRALEALDSGNPLEGSALDQAAKTLVSAAACLPPDDAMLLPRLRQLAGRESVNWIPSKENPLGKEDLLGKLVLLLQIRDLKNADPESIEAHPAAEFFPGAVPEGAKRVEITRSIDSAQHGWHATGAYAVPGESITVSVPEPAASAGLRIRIGAQSDRLWHKDTWHRVPEISFETAVTGTETKFANAFGGLIYLVLPAGSGLGEFEVAVSGAVAAPIYVHGETDLQAWREEIRNELGPWAEIGSDKLIVTVPSSVAAELDDPAEVMELWDSIQDHNADLAALPRTRGRPDRIVPDEQISAGYMHAGYPIMTHLDQNDKLANVEHLSQEGNWGLYHELGHNHQHRDWTFGGTVEVTCNLFTLYIFEKVVGIKTADHSRGSAQFLEDQMKKYDFTNPNFDQWKSDPFLALAMYVQLQHAFGWEAYRKVFAEYEALPAEERPASDDEKRDQWMQRMSRTVGHNLCPFFRTWGVPVSDAACESLADLPEWRPADFPPGNGNLPTHVPTVEPSATPSPVPSRTPTETPSGSLVFLPIGGAGWELEN